VEKLGAKMYEQKHKETLMRFIEMITIGRLGRGFGQLQGFGERKSRSARVASWVGDVHGRCTLK